MASSKEEGQYAHPVSECYLRFEKTQSERAHHLDISLITLTPWGKNQIFDL